MGSGLLKFLFFQLYFAGQDRKEQLKLLSLDSPDWPECQVNNVDQQRPGHWDKNQVSSPLDHIGGWPRGDRGFHALPLHTSAATSRMSGRRSTLIWRTVASSSKVTSSSSSLAGVNPAGLLAPESHSPSFSEARARLQGEVSLASAVERGHESASDSEAEVCYLFWKREIAKGGECAGSGSANLVTLD